MTLSANSKYNKYQLWVVPAGQGKSRIAGAAAYHILKTTNKHVYVVFANERLKKDDKDELENIWTFATSQNKNAEKRLHYVCSLKEITKHKYGEVVLVDESDEIIFKDLVLFYQKTKAPETKVICLTATADDGFKEGSEHKVLEALKFKVYQNSDNEESIDENQPKIHAEKKITCSEDLNAVVHEETKWRTVLIFAKQRYYEMAKLIKGIVEVKDTTKDDLATLHKKRGVSKF